MILMLTKHPSYSFSCLTPYLCVFCRNEENVMKSKQYGQELKNLCMEESMVATIGRGGNFGPARWASLVHPELRPV